MSTMPVDLVALEVVAIEAGAAGALDVHGLGDLLLEPGDRHDDLEGGAGSELGLDGFVEQRVIGVLEDGVPVGLGQVNGELVGDRRWGGWLGRGSRRCAGPWRTMERRSCRRGPARRPSGPSRSMVRRRSLPGTASSWRSWPELLAVGVDDDVAGAVSAAEGARRRSAPRRIGRQHRRRL